jgi:hypothetical protein
MDGDCENIRISLSKLGPGGIKVDSMIANLTSSRTDCCGVGSVIDGFLYILCDQQNSSVITLYVPKTKCRARRNY